MKRIFLIGFVSIMMVSGGLTVFADVAIPTTTNVYFEDAGVPHDSPVDYSVTCYGYSTYPPDFAIPADYDPLNPSEVYSYSASCSGYGCGVDEGYYLNYRNIDYCDLEATTDGQTYTFSKYATSPVPTNCSEENFLTGRTCEMTVDLVNNEVIYRDHIEVDPVFPYFKDVSWNHQYFDAVQYVQEEGIVVGYSNGTYGPENRINRAEFTKIIIEARYDDAVIDSCVSTKSFPDVPADEWYAKYVCVALNNHIIDGYPDGTFRPAYEINFAEAAKIIVGGFGYYTQPSEPWYATYTQKLTNMAAVPSSISGPAWMLTRGEMAHVIYKLLTYVEGIYQNNKYAFSFSYDPEKYSVIESRSRGGATGDESDLIRMTAIGESCPAVDIFVSTATLEQELSDLEYRLIGNTVQTTVDGITATQRSGEITENLPPCGSEKTELVFENGGNVFVISAFKDWETALDELLMSINF